MTDGPAAARRAGPSAAASPAEQATAALDARIVSALRELGPLSMPDLCAATGLRRYAASERLLALRSTGRVAPAWHAGLDHWQALDSGRR